MYEAKTIRLCKNCIGAIKSRGEMVYIGNEVDYDLFEDEHGTEADCEWCEEVGGELYECIFL